MTANRGWTYYRLGDYGTSTPPLYYRYDLGDAELLTDELTWVPGNGNMISHYIENGETDLDQITRAEIEREIGAAIPA
jgi:hypothetical protein